jgi:hypothetical protein
MDGVLDKVQQLWAAADVTAEGDAILGEPRTVDGVKVVDWLDAQAWMLSKDMASHPIDPHLAAERDLSNRLYEPYPADHWPGLSRVPEARWRRAVVLALTAVRKGLRPSQAGKLAAHIARELESHHRAQAELRVYHLCRLAGLMADAA